VTKQDTLENQAKNIFLGIGSNLGNRIANIEKAKSLLLQNIFILFLYPIIMRLHLGQIQINQNF